MSASGTSCALRRVAIVGPESVGKTTLARRLAEHFGTEWIPEHAREFYDRKGVVYEPADIPPIVAGQQALTREREGRARRVVFADTDLLTTCLWSDTLYGGCPEEARAAAAAQRWDLTLLLAPDVPWTPDPQRVQADPRAREVFFDELGRRLAAAERRVVVVRGPWEARLARAIGAVEALLAQR